MEEEQELPNWHRMEAGFKIETYGEYKNIDLTKEQYERLLILMRCGVNTVDIITDKLWRRLCDVEQNIWKYSTQYSTDLVKYNLKYDYYSPTEKLISECEKITDRYNSYTILDLLADGLAERDLRLSGESIEQKEELIERYRKELNKNAIRNLYFIKPDQL